MKISYWSELTKAQRVGAVGAATGFIAVLSVVCAGVLHHQCFEAMPFSPPIAGTPRAGYCDAVQPWKPWVTFTVVPTLLFVVAGFGLRRRPIAVACIGIVIVLCLILNVVIVGQLEYAPEFP